MMSRESQWKFGGPLDFAGSRGLCPPSRIHYEQFPPSSKLAVPSSSPACLLNSTTLVIVIYEKCSWPPATGHSRPARSGNVVEDFGQGPRYGNLKEWTRPVRVDYGHSIRFKKLANRFS